MTLIKQYIFFLHIFFVLSCKEKAETLESNLEIFNVETGERKTIYSAQKHFEAPNWSRDGKFILFNSEGKIFTVPQTGGEPTLLKFDSNYRCNNDHGLSPDGSNLIVSQHVPDSGKSYIYMVPMKGGTARKITTKAPSYWHGWSPDGDTLAYCAERNGEYDVYSIPVSGGEETRLTNANGLDDGPDYSADGQYIYFNSNRTGQMQIWKMRTDGSGQKQVTSDEYNNWFPHPSPDGKWLVFLSYEKEVEGHPANKNVMLRMMPLKGGGIKILTKLFGGQGTINVPSWSPDSKQFSFVSYNLH